MQENVKAENWKKVIFLKLLSNTTNAEFTLSTKQKKKNQNGQRIPLFLLYYPQNLTASVPILKKNCAKSEFFIFSRSGNIHENRVA